MGRKVELINDSETAWDIPTLGGISVPETSSLDITAIISDNELVKAIQNCGLGDIFDSQHYLKVNDYKLSADESKNYLSCCAINKVIFEAGDLKGLELSYSDAHTVQIAKGRIVDDSESCVIVVDSPITVDIETSGAGGLDTGSEASMTWYFIFLIKNPATGTVNGLLSTSVDNPTLPSGYTVKRRIGSVFNDSSSNFLPFKQYEYGRIRKYFYDYSYNMIAAGTASTYTMFNCSVVPSVARIVRLRMYIEWTDTGQGDVTGYLRRTGTYATDQLIFRGYHKHEVLFDWDCNSSQQFDYKVASNNQCWIAVHGWDEKI